MAYRAIQSKAMVAVALLVAAAAPGGAALAARHAEASGRSASANEIPFTQADVFSADGQAFSISWSAPAAAGPVDVYAETVADDVGPNRALRKIGHGGPTGALTATNLPLATRWYFVLRPAHGHQLITADRSLHLKTAPNFRDIGGYRTEDGRWVKMGMIYRSDQLDRLSDQDLATIAKLAPSLVVDFRTEAERKAGPDRLPPGSQALVADVLASDPPDASAVLRAKTPDASAALLTKITAQLVTLPSATTAYGHLMSAIPEATAPIVYHCTAGKDRTGWATAVLLTALGVPRDVVVGDYLASNGYLAKKNQTMFARMAPEMATNLEPALTVRTAYLEAAFQAVDQRYGAFDRYLKDGLGVDQEALARLRARLLAGAPMTFAPSIDDNALRLNQIQVIGTHNSYHAGLTPEMAKLLKQRNPKAFDTLDYRHADLATQLDHGVRQLELDIYADAKGARFAHPFGAALSPGGAASFDPQGVMLKPGFKVMHLQDIDYVSNCQPFIACLSAIRAWSEVHPGHLPLFILVETKTQPPLPGVPMVSPEPFTPAVLDALDAEIRSVFPANVLIVPDQVRGRHATLPEAVLDNGWPSLAQARGKAIFLLDQKNVTAPYLIGHPALAGRVLFTNGDPGQDDAAFIEANDSKPEEIVALVKRGYIVRTRADADTQEGRSGDIIRRDGALASGAQIISTDYPSFEPAPWTGYGVALPGQASGRCNPVTAPAACAGGSLDDRPKAP